jgi:hypothetical protein
MRSAVQIVTLVGRVVLSGGRPRASYASRSSPRGCIFRSIAKPTSGLLRIPQLMFGWLDRSCADCQGRKQLGINASAA